MKRLSVCIVVLCMIMFAGPGCRISPPAPTQAELAAEAICAAWPDAVKQAMEFEGEGSWRGGSVVAAPRVSGAGAMKWEKHASNGRLDCKHAPKDLSAFNTMSFQLHSSHANGGTFVIVMESNCEKGVFSYYSKKVVVDWIGWKQLSFRLNSFGRTRRPAGWNRITRMRFSAGGWNQEPTDVPVWVFDDLRFSFDPVSYRPGVDIHKYVDEPEMGAFGKKLKKDHPRLVLLDKDLPRVREFISTPLGKKWYEATEKTAEKLYALPVRKHELPDGRRLLPISRDVLNRMCCWGFMYRVERDRKWLDRAWKEMESVVNYPDWNPDHYLDTAEMMHAMAIGYDWFYNDLSEAQRTIIREGIWKHGLRLSYAAYMGLDAEGMQNWIRVTNNWNFVCNGGSSLAAMALFEDDPQKCAAILHAAFQYIQIPIEHFEPDGAWWEGTSYWGYSMRYLLSYMRGLETAFGTDFGFIKALRNTGFSHTGDFPIYLSSPSNGIFNFADSGSGRGAYKHWGLLYLAARFENPLYLHFEEKNATGSVNDIIYHEPFTSFLAIQDVPLDKYFRKTEVATMRSSWTDPDALFAGIKCGRNGIAHAHQDLGSFAFYGLGEKWAMDSGTESQTYQSHRHHIPRHHFYRVREEGHNTLVFNPTDKYSQYGKGKSEIVRFESTLDEAFAVADLSNAYRDHGVSVIRGYRFLDQRRSFLVQDEISSDKTNDLWWFAHSNKGNAFSLDASGRVAKLQRRNKTCYVKLLSPSSAKFTVMDAEPLPTSPNPDIQSSSKGLKKLAIHIPAAKNVTIAVLFTPVYDFEEEPSMIASVTPIDSWKLPAATGPTCKSITVGGELLDGFSPAVYTYSVTLPNDTKQLPAVVASPSRGVTLDPVVMPQSFPGTARLVAHAGEKTAVYTIRFLPASVKR
ncbi:MAG: heparinase II/III family protein [Kiritimatiellae bacterium]|nr:heparinase II/III family protein [Kiritimatiellia bacterium]